MEVTFEQVRAALVPEEPNYRSAARLGAEAMPHLKSMVEGGEPMLAAKAAYLASLIGGEQAVDVLLSASAHSEASVRVAAASGTRNLEPAQAEALRDVLASDADPGVRAKNAQAAGEDPAEVWESAEPPPPDLPDPLPEPPPADGRMPGEQAREELAEGLMPGEADAVRPAVAAEGLMPGEQPGR